MTDQIGVSGHPRKEGMLAESVRDLRATLADMIWQRDDLYAKLDSTMKDRARILTERDKTFGLMLTRADEARAEGFAAGLEAAAKVANSLLVRSRFGTGEVTEVVYSDFVAAAIRALDKTGTEHKENEE